MSKIFPLNKTASLVAKLKTTFKVAPLIAATAMVVAPTVSADMYISSFGTNELLKVQKGKTQQLPLSFDVTKSFTFLNLDITFDA